MKKNILLLAICLSSFMGCLDLTIVNTALPAIQLSLGVSVTVLQWVMTSLLVALASSMVLVGRLADIYGQRKVMLAGLATFGLSSLLAACSTSISLLITARVLQGVGIAILYTVPPSIISKYFKKSTRGKAMGLYFAASGFGMASGPFLGGVITSALSWHWIFYLNIPLVMISYLICYRQLPKTYSHQRQKVDKVGALLLAITLSSLIIATTKFSATYTMINAGFLILAVATLVSFIFWGKQHKQPIIDFRLFKYRMFTIGGLSNIALACFYGVAFFLMPLYLHFAKGFTEMQIGFMLLSTTATMALISPFVDRILKKLSVWAVLTTGFCLFAISAMMQAFFVKDTSLLMIITSYMLMGAGWALILNPSFASALNSVPTEKSGSAMGTLGTLHNAGASIGLAAGVMLLSHGSHGLTPTAFLTEQHTPFLFIAGIAVAMSAVLIKQLSKNMKNAQNQLRSKA